MTKNSKKLKTSSSNAKVTRKDAPLAVGVVRQTSRPSITTRKTAVVVRHKELVGTVSNGATTGYALTSISAGTPGYDINPACSTLFPWLSSIAINFERYSFRKLSFDFIPGQSASTAGRFYAAVDYDYDDPTAGSKAQLMGNITAVESPVWLESSLQCIPAELHRDMPHKYVSSVSRQNFIEPRTAYGGFLMVAFDTPTTNLVIDVWVSYEVELELPVVELNLIVDGTSASAQATADVCGLGGGAIRWGLPYMAPISSGGCRSVQAGVGLNPALDVGTLVGTPTLATYAYDLFSALRSGHLDLLYKFSVTGTTPATLFATNIVGPALAMFSSAGTYLGNAVTSAIVTEGASPVQSVSTASALVNTLATISLTQLFTTYPLGRYLVPLLASTGALGAGTSVVAARMEL